MKKGVERVFSVVGAVVVFLFLLFLLIEGANWAVCSLVGYLERTFPYRRSPVIATVPATSPSKPIAVSPPAKPRARPVRQPAKQTVRAQTETPRPPASPPLSVVFVPAPSPKKTRVLVIYECPLWFRTADAFSLVRSSVEQALLNAGAEVVVFEKRQVTPPFDIALSVRVHDMGVGSMPIGQYNVPQRVAQVTISARNGDVIYAQSVGRSIFFGQACTSCVGYAFDGYSAASARAASEIIPKLALKREVPNPESEISP